MKLYIDTKDIGKTVSYKEENGKKQYLYAHDKEGFEFKDIADYTKQVRKEVCEEIRDNLKDMDFLAHETEFGERINCFSKYKVLDILIRVEDQIQGETK